MAGKKASCPACRELEECNLEIPYALLRQGIQDGCELCDILHRGVSEFVNDGELEAIDSLVLSVDISLLVTVKGKTPKDPPVVEFYTLLGSPSPWPNIGPGRHVSTNSSSDECVALARGWIQACLSSHAECKRPGKPLLPTRVIEVGESDADVRIFVNRDNKRDDYVALSHCWGGAKPTVLLKSNLEAMQKRLVLDAAESKTFADAINFVRRLGIPYLWIDSLCILQDKDDLQDWKREAPKMSSVYNGATVTLSAASSMDTRGGLFPDPSLRAKRQRIVEIPVPGISSPSSTTTIFARGRQLDPTSVAETVHSLAVPETPNLRSRAWVLQEDQLSPRTLHFRPEELAWTCATCSRCECRLRPSLPAPHPFRADVEAASADPDAQEKAERTVMFNLRWPSIVMDYTRRALTQPRDRVAALAGLATYVERCTTDTYYCGMWYEDLRFQLLWYVNRAAAGGGQVQRDAGEPVAPGGLNLSRRFKFPFAQTWSWMGVPGPISYFERHPRGCAPSHPDILTGDAVAPVGLVINVGRLPLDWADLTGPVVVAPLLLLTRVVPLSYDRETRRFGVARYAIDDFSSESLKVYFDVEMDEARLELVGEDTGDQYVLILAGRWEGEGMTILSMETVCILGRRPLEEELPLVMLGRQFQERSAAQQAAAGGDASWNTSDWTLPDPEFSYFRVGLARGAGSLDAWDRAGVPAVEKVFLF
ncbi:heterokaryon incompatibility protein-domain-containing protein [Podospora conica]|nr:heterokaryon incompatibility protein-domain-containing protein [Schizothecium conicum]